MLTTLRISGFAVVDAVEVRFGRGLNVLTGETGAGKSLLVNALHLVLGGRLSADLPRVGRGAPAGGCAGAAGAAGGVPGRPRPRLRERCPGHGRHARVGAARAGG